MEIHKHYNYWLKSAKDDLESAFDMMTIKRYHWALFVGHLALEKVLKAKYVLKYEDHPPKTHNLLYLTSKVDIVLNEEMKKDLQKINKYNLSTRYSDYEEEFERICTREFAEENLNKIKEIYQWLLHY